MPRYAVFGASGLIGGLVVQELLGYTNASVTVFTRRPLNYADPRINEMVTDLTDQDSLNSLLKGFDAVFVAIGTTQKKERGNVDAYRKVDYSIPVTIAKACVTNSIPSLLLVSSIGANSQSRNFYLRTKGEVEDTIAALPIPRVRFFQPSLLLGVRKEFRLGEKISQYIMPLLAFLLPARYRPIVATAVARAMVRAVADSSNGVRRYAYSDMLLFFLCILLMNK